MSRYKTGFTLIELLVVIAIIGMLVAILLPAVQAAREAGRRTVCLNNIRQVTLGCANFESSHQRYPGYQETLLPTDPANARPASWLVILMPYYEQQEIYDLWNDATVNPYTDPRTRPYLKILRCPSAPNLNTQIPDNSYVCNAGWIPHPND